MSDVVQRFREQCAALNANWARRRVVTRAKTPRELVLRTPLRKAPSPQQAIVLEYLRSILPGGAGQPPRMREIAAACGIANAYIIAGVLQRLEAKGLIRRGYRNCNVEILP